MTKLTEWRGALICVLLSLIVAIAVSKGPPYVVLIVLLLGTVVAFLQPLIIIALPILFSPLLGQTGESMIGPLNAMAILGLWFLCLGGITILLNFAEILKERLIIILLALLILTGTSLGPSHLKLVSLEEFVRMASAITMLPLTYLFAREESNRYKIVGFVYLSALLPILVGFYQIATGDVSQGPKVTALESITGISRIYSTFYDVHPYAKYLLVLLPLPLAVMLLERRSIYVKICSFSAFAVLFINLIYTFARSQLIGFILAGGFILQKLGKLRIRTILLIVPAILLLFSVTGTLERFRDVAVPVNLESAGPPENSLVSRLLIWKKALPLALQKPFMGHGAATFEPDIGIEAHNDYLGLFYDLGIAAPLLYLLFLTTAAKSTLTIYKNCKISSFDRKLALAMSGLSIAFIVVTAVENYIYSTIMWWMYYAQLGCVLAAAKDELCEN
ncbi:MAG: O-antigen ligase family protein [Deltaproteobacteria bacterium]|nr:O-antigen ligase family protein [Deltaproteobacteria bacterium]